MKRLISNHIITLAIVAITFGFTSCIDSIEPSEVLTSDQVRKIPSSQEGLINGILSYMITFDSWGSGDDPVNDWGYPCQMFYREILGADIPVYSSNYSYWTTVESGVNTRFKAYYTYRFYYDFIATCNNVTSVVDPATASPTSKNYLGIALAYRAMAYLDIARQFEFKKTGIASLDDKATKNGIWGLTVPIVTEKTTKEMQRHNPRAPFYKMYRFILTDLNHAEEYLANYTRPDKNLPNLSVVYGLKARLWMEMASRFDQSSADLNAAIAAEDSASIEYDKLGITTARECYEKARTYARKAASGYSPVTETQWHSTQDGFNKDNQAWMWKLAYTTREQISYLYCTFTSTVTSETNWGLAGTYGATRMIGSALYDKMPESDWRRYSWIDPDAAGTHEGYEKYDSITIGTKKERLTLLDEEAWKQLPAYANIKFRPAKGNITDTYEGQFISLPLMRMEEMVFIDIEATAHLDGVAAGVTALKDFMNTYRYTDNSYQANNVTTMEDFIKELMVQKRIEFWGEGITYFDYKRLALQIRRKDNTNYEPSARINSKEGYVCPWMNFFILEYETHNNVACKPNPDTSGSLTVTNQ